MPSHPHQPVCGCSSCASGSGRRHFLKNLSITGAVFSGLPQVAGALTETGARDRDWSKSRVLRQDGAKRISILHTADIHGQLYTHDEFFWENNGPVYKKRGGMAVLKTMLNILRKENPGRTLVVDGGDCFQGSGVAALSEGRAIVPLINNIGYDLMLPGNWEVVYGKEMMQKDLGAYDAQKICANMFHHTTDDHNGELLYHPYWTTHFGDIKLGFIGYNDPMTPKRQSPAYSEGITFTKPEKNVARYIRILRDYERCDMVFLVTHMGLAQQVDLANQSYIDGVDFILGADTHERVREPLQGKYARVTEPGAFGSFVSKLDLIIEDGKVKDVAYQLLDVDPEKYKPDPEIRNG
jgi:S-sulfosulfanyl-L-cysteine sulfohydrolase